MLSYFGELTTNAGVAHFLGLNEAFYGDFSHYKKEIKTYNSITVDQVKKSCKKLFRDKNFVFASVWNKNPRN